MPIVHTAKKVYLARFGGIGKVVKQKRNFKSNGEMTFHNAPERYGYYAFLYPYLELFLLGSPVNNGQGRFVEKKAKVYKKFIAVDGTLWTHMQPKKHMILDEKGAWYKIHVSNLHLVLKKHIAETNAYWESMGGKRTKNIYNYFSKDDMEIFCTRDTKINS